MGLKVSIEQIKKETGTTTKEFEKNLDYLIISSETEGSSTLIISKP